MEKITEIRIYVNGEGLSTDESAAIAEKVGLINFEDLVRNWLDSNDKISVEVWADGYLQAPMNKVSLK